MVIKKVLLHTGDVLTRIRSQSGLERFVDLDAAFDETTPHEERVAFIKEALHSRLIIHFFTNDQSSLELAAKLAAQAHCQVKTTVYKKDETGNVKLAIYSHDTDGNLIMEDND